MEATNSENAKKLISESDKPVVVDFSAEWCGPCKMLSPILEELAGEYSGKTDIIKVDIDESQDLAQQYGIVSVPTLVFFKNGDEVDRVIGFQSKDVLMQKLDGMGG
jgi:thioredoxin 1